MPKLGWVVAAEKISNHAAGSSRIDRSAWAYNGLCVLELAGNIWRLDMVSVLMVIVAQYLSWKAEIHAFG